MKQLSEDVQLEMIKYDALAIQDKPSCLTHLLGTAIDTVCTKGQLALIEMDDAAFCVDKKIVLDRLKRSRKITSLNPTVQSALSRLIKPDDELHTLRNSVPYTY